MRQQPRGVLPVLAVFLFLTGVSALLEEILWARMLHRLLGGTALSIATVLAGFLGGIAVGGFLAERWTARLRRPLAVLGAIELVAGGAAFLFTALLRGAGPLAAHPIGPAVLLLVLVVFTVPLGASFPVLVAYLSGARARPSRVISVLYGLNALGGSVGALLAGFGVIPLLGESGAIELAAGIQVVVGVAAIWLSNRVGEAREGDFRGAAESVPSPVPSRAGRLHLLLFTSGLVAFFWEVLWTRILVLTVGSSVYALSIVAAGVLAGIGVASVVLSGGTSTGRGFWCLPLALGGLLAAAFFFVSCLPDAYLIGVRSFDIGRVVWGVLVAGMVALVPSLLVGTLFPWAVSRAPVRCGSMVAVNAVGAALGAYLGGPLGAGVLGLESSFLLGVFLVGLLGLCGLINANRLPALRRRVIAVGVFLPFAVVLAASGREGFRSWDLGRLVSGVYQWSERDLRDPAWTLDAFAASRNIDVLVSGREVIVTVERELGANTLHVKGNGKTEGSVPLDSSGQAGPSRANLPTQILLAAYPALLRPGAPAALVGFGSGVTAGTMHRFGLHPLVVMEIEAAFLDAIRDPAVSPSFAPWLGGVLESPDLHLHFGDARRLLMGPLREVRWRVLVSQPSEPWISGSASLFTREFFEIVSDHLEDDGIFVQWLQLYKTDIEGLRVLVRTFRRVFNRVFIVRPPASGALILLGSRGPLELERLLEPIPEERQAVLAATGVESGADLLALVVLGPDGVERWVEADRDGRMNTDGHNLLEFSGPLLLRGGLELTRQNLRVLQELGGGDPIVSYVPALRGRTAFLRHLAERNNVFGDFWEALALLEGDTSPGAERLRETIRRDMERAP